MKKAAVLMLTLLWAFPSFALKAAKVKVHHTKVAVKKSVHKTFVGMASWYGKQHAGKKMANGERFNPRKLTVAHRWLPLGTKVRIFNLENGLSVDAVVTDRGPFKHQRVMDLSEACAKQIRMIGKGVAKIMYVPLPEVQVVTAQIPAESL